MRARRRMEQVYFGTSDIAEMLGISETKARDLMYEFAPHGKLLRCGRLLRVPASDFRRWLDAHMTRPLRELAQR